MTGERVILEPPFMIGALGFRTWIVPDHPNELGLVGERYEWRSEDGRCVIKRNLGMRTFTVLVDGKLIAQREPTLTGAMVLAAARHLRLERRRAA